MEYGEGSSEADGALLLEVLDLRERVDDLRRQLGHAADDASPQHSAAQASLSRLHATVASRIRGIEQQLATAFDSSDFATAKAGVGELAYFNNISREIAQLQTVT